MHRRSLALALSVSAFAALGALSSSALATTVTYEGSYSAAFGEVHCVGKHKVNKKYPGTEEEGGRDKFTCTAVSGTLTGLKAKETGDGFQEAFPGVYSTGYYSDYYYFLSGTDILSKTFSYRVNNKDTAFKGIAVF